MTERGQKRGLVAQFTRLLVGAGLACFVLFLALRAALGFGVDYYARHSDLRQRATERRIEAFQSYVAGARLASTDTAAITDWVSRQDFTLLELYRDQVLVYSSFMPEQAEPEQPGPGQADPAPEGKPTPFYDWMPRAAVTFTDGELQALLYYDPARAMVRWGAAALMALCIGLFLVVFLLGCRRIVRYICLLSQEVQVMESGDFTRPVTVRGADELTALAACLDSMRLTLGQQRRQEAETSARVKDLITQMSHDLRTPLTTLLLYTEIVSSGKYQDEAQLAAYLAKIDAKARQIKQLSDNLFEYALVTRDTVVALERPAPFSQIFEEPLAEFADQLGQRGFACVLDLGPEDPCLQVYRPYIRRIFDNIASNILKYADPAQPVAVRCLREGEAAGLAFENAALPAAPAAAESTRVGLASIETMMDKMHATARVTRVGRRFSICLLFPVLPDQPQPGGRASSPAEEESGRASDPPVR